MRPLLTARARASALRRADVSPPNAAALHETLEELRDRFKADHERLRAVEIAVGDLRQALGTRLTVIEERPAVVSKLHFTTPQTAVLLMTAASIIVAVMKITGGMDAQFRLQDERNTTITAAVEAVRKAQLKSDYDRAADIQELRQMIKELNSKGVKK